jgi:transcriptional regulator with XRE-family HTH domain
MARMASRPRIGALVRDGIERKGLRQREVAEKLGVSRSAVNAWANDRAYPQSYVIVALEELLGIKIPRWEDPDETVRELIAAYEARKPPQERAG